MEDKLKLIKRQREARSRSQKIQDTWEKIDKNEELSVKEKLERLIHLTKKEKSQKSEKVFIEPAPREPILFFENPYPLHVRYGKIPLSRGLEISGDVFYFLSRDKAFKGLDLSTSLFIDLETTGLAGGTGVIPFLIGMGFYRNNKFNIVQYFLGEPAEERKLIHQLSRFISEMDFQSIVSFNGKGFDLPLLETRFILNRQPFPLSEIPHLDFLFSARSLWKHKHESCRLFHLAQQVVEAERAEDIPAAEIPVRYFQFLRTGDWSLMEPVLYHNQEDILSLLALVITGARLFAEEREEILDEERDALDLFGVGKVFESAGDVKKSTYYFERALERKLPKEVAHLAKTKLSYHFKKKQEWEKAVSLWQDMISENQLFCFRELAMYYEHKEKNYEEAKKIVEEGLALSLGFSSKYEKDLSHRIERLNEKIRRENNKKK
jgi:hypothetical protein